MKDELKKNIFWFFVILILAIIWVSIPLFYDFKYY